MKKKKTDYEYGGFHGGDPRDFQPDPDLCSSEEINNWKKACKIYNKAEKEGKPLKPIERKISKSGFYFHEYGPFGIGIQKYKR